MNTSNICTLEKIISSVQGEAQNLDDSILKMQLYEISPERKINFASPIYQINHLKKVYLLTGVIDLKKFWCLLEVVFRKISFFL